jgi:RNA polymerase sigma factor (sigma-70 family)
MPENETEKILEEQYKNLTPRQREILEMRLKGKTLEEIGNKFGITRERVRQILARLKNKKLTQ